jgi:putative DNA primase/helicase
MNRHPSDFLSATFTDPLPAFREALFRNGITPPETIIADSVIHRFRVEGDKAGSQNGWYLIYCDGRPSGAFGNWKTGQTLTWTADSRGLTLGEQMVFKAKLDAARKQRDIERKATHEATAATARARWGSAKPADPSHPYLVAKGVRPHNLRQSGSSLLIPLYDTQAVLWSLQTITPEGGKFFMKGGRVSGLFCPIGNFSEVQTRLICEGAATGASLHEDTGHPVLCAMNAGNLKAVAIAARAKWPDAELVICADNDRHTKGNPGVTSATEAAKAVGAKLAVPQFPEGVPGTDFNDLAAFYRRGGV